MDPNANLQEARELAEQILADYEYDGGHGVDEHDAARLAELFSALDGWISKGGFLPTEWRR